MPLKITKTKSSETTIFWSVLQRQASKSLAVSLRYAGGQLLRQKITLDNPIQACKRASSHCGSLSWDKDSTAQETFLYVNKALIVEVSTLTTPSCSLTTDWGHAIPRWKRSESKHRGSTIGQSISVFPALRTSLSAGPSSWIVLRKLLYVQYFHSRSHYPNTKLEAPTCTLSVYIK